MDKTTADRFAWGKNLKDWREIQEKQGLKGYEYVLGLLPDQPSKILDLGCGTGTFCELAIKRKMQPTGLDTSAQFIEEARSNSPKSTFVNGNMQKLPFRNNAFDVVCSFNSFQYAANLECALLEAKRVLTDQGRLFILIWGSKSTCEIASFLKIVKERLPPVPSDSRNPFSLSEDHTLEKKLRQNSFTAVKSTVIPSYWHYADITTALKGLLSLGALAPIIEYHGLDNVQEAILSSLAPYQQTGGNIEFKNHYKIVSASK